MDGVIPKLGVGAIRINSDILTFPQVGNQMRRVKVPAAPGKRYVGLVLLFSTHTGEPLAIMPDGVMQRARVGATNAIAAKYLSREDATVLANTVASSRDRYFAAIAFVAPTRARCITPSGIIAKGSPVCVLNRSTNPT